MPFNFIRHFLKLESSSGILLFLAALVAFILANSPWSNLHHLFFAEPIFVSLPFHRSLEFWINDGLMSLFFFMVTLELKREFLKGELSSVSKALLPGIAALGGMIIPAVIYFLVNFSHPETLKGWAIPVATDIAFALGVLSLFGNKIPLSLKIFLMALAIFDDVGAIIIIAIFHTTNLSFNSCLLSLFTMFILFLLNFFGVKRLVPYWLLGLLLWVFVYNSGLHPTISGVLFALLIPFSQSRRIEFFLHPWVAFFIMPLFALCNAGVSLKGLTPHILIDYVTLGIILGLVIGKPLGVFTFIWLSVKSGWAKLPREVSWYEIFGMAILCGIGFTMSLFLGTLAFEHDNPIYLIQVRIGVLVGSLLSGFIGMVVLYSSVQGRRRQVESRE